MALTLMEIRKSILPLRLKENWQKMYKVLTNLLQTNTRKENRTQEEVYKHLFGLKFDNLIQYLCFL